MATVRKGDVNESEGRGDAPAFPRSSARIQNVITSVAAYSPIVILVGIPVAFFWGAGMKLWQRAYELGQRCVP